MRRPQRAATLVAVVATMRLAAPADALARPLQLEDLLQRENFGQVALTPDGRWLLVEQRGPLAATPRFDWGALNVLFRTRLLAADLRADGRMQPLFTPRAGEGYRAGPISPDGARVAVYRLTARRWELGIATFATRTVRWLDVTPEAPGDTRTLQWASPTRLLALTVPSERLPFDVRYEAPQAARPPLWATTARGEAAVTIAGSGRWIGAHVPPAATRLVEISARDGALRTLADGEFVDLELSASGRWVALTEAGEDISLLAGRPAQGPFGISVRRMRLRLLDLATRAIWGLPAHDDVLTTLLAWSPQSDELLAYVRADGAPWTAGDLLRIDPAMRRVQSATPGVRIAIAGRPERVAVGWWGDEPMVFGRRDGGGRDDWWRVGALGAVRLTGELGAPQRGGIAVGRRFLVVAADNAAWRIDRAGHATALAAPFAPLPPRFEGFPDRTVFALPVGDSLPGVLGASPNRRLVRVTSSGRTVVLAQLAAGEAVLALADRRVVSDAISGGGEETLAWRDSAGPALPLARINTRFADIERPPPVPVAHRGPNGEALRSWVFLPARPVVGGPPLVVVPYPGAVYVDPPVEIWDDPPMAPAAVLLGAGYAVLIPSLPTWRGGQGPADGLAKRVLAIVDVAAREPALQGRFDPTRLALWGHSFGGYGVLNIVAQTDRFRAAVATAPASDLVSVWGQFGPARLAYTEDGPTTPWSAGWVEAVQGDMRVPPWQDPARYLANSPVMAADRITTPVLIAAGEMDGSHPGQAQEMFSALYRQDKDALLLTYWGEQHLFASPGNLRDLYRRGQEFLRTYLRPARGAGAAALADSPGSASASGEPRPPPLPPRRGRRRRRRR